MIKGSLGSDFIYSHSHFWGEAPRASSYDNLLWLLVYPESLPNELLKDEKCFFENKILYGQYSKPIVVHIYMQAYA